MLERPTHLVKDRLAATVALVLGIASFAIVAIVHPNIETLPDPWLSVPGFAATVAASIVSLVRREPRGYWLWALGLGVAGAAIVLGWFLMLGVVIGATAIVILILHAVM